MPEHMPTDAVRTIPMSLPGTPHVVRLVQDGIDYSLTVWTPEMWGRIPESQRPDDAHSMSGGAYCTLRPVG